LKAKNAAVFVKHCADTSLLLLVLYPMILHQNTWICWVWFSACVALC